jgi:hypothetical protein
VFVIRDGLVRPWSKDVGAMMQSGPSWKNAIVFSCLLSLKNWLGGVQKKERKYYRLCNALFRCSLGKNATAPFAWQAKSDWWMIQISVMARTHVQGDGGRHMTLAMETGVHTSRSESGRRHETDSTCGWGTRSCSPAPRRHHLFSSRFASPCPSTLPCFRFPWDISELSNDSRNLTC